jgi:hypothetical protein
LECCKHSASEILGFSLPPLPRRFRREKRFLPFAVPRFTCAKRVHPPVNLTPLQSPFVSHLPRSFDLGAFLGVAFPLRDINPQQVYDGPPKSATFPSSAFLTPSTVCTAAGLMGLFHPTATSRVHPSGVFTSRTAKPPRRRPVPSRRLALRRCRWLPTGATPSCPAPRALLRARIRSSNDGG